VHLKDTRKAPFEGDTRKISIEKGEVLEKRKYAGREKSPLPLKAEGEKIQQQGKENKDAPDIQSAGENRILRKKWE